METVTDATKWLTKLEEKYRQTGQNLNAHLEGLFHAKNITYWDYINLETLLSLQQTRTDFPDEPVFIMYHQVTELYFKMALREYSQLAESTHQSEKEFILRVGRINRYFDCLTQSFSVMTDGMDVGQYLQFRMTLTPASGYQSAQFRLIELSSTAIDHLVDRRFRKTLSATADIPEKLDKLYWKAAGINPKSGEKTMTLKSFEDKYNEALIQHATDYENKHVWAKYQSLSPKNRKSEGVIRSLKDLDHNVNYKWPMAHYHAALRYLEGKPNDIKATGGSEWKKYLHPSHQKRLFFPELWNHDELENWEIADK